jgi:phage tail sheath protein FI
MATLVSPGVSISVSDESFYAAAGAGSVPLIVIATAQDKKAPDGTSTASYTTSATAGKLYQITSQRELLQNFGNPVFKTSGSTPLHGSEQNEYGLMAAYSFLGIANRAYVLRADIDLNELDASSTAPTKAPANGAYWLDSTLTSWGLKRYESSAWVLKTVKKPGASEVDGNGDPKAAFGVTGEFCVTYYTNTGATKSTIDFYEKIANVWRKIGSSAWSSAVAGSAGDFQFASHLSIPTTKSGGGGLTTGDIFLQETAPNNGSNIVVKEYSTTTSAFAIENIVMDELSSTVYASHYASPKVGDLWADGGTEASLTLKRHNGSATLSVASSTALADGINFSTHAGKVSINISINGASDIPVTFTGSNVSAVSVDEIVSSINGATGFSATTAVASNVAGKVTVTTSDGKDIGFAAGNVAGYDSSDINIPVGTYSNFKALSYEASDNAITGAATNGTLWYDNNVANTNIDILYQNAGTWATLSKDVQFAASSPTLQSDGSSSLVDGDLWIDSSDLENFPKIYKRASSAWVLVDNTDQVTSDGIIFADFRASSSGSLISTANGLPNAALYPSGMIAWNKMASVGNVKQYDGTSGLWKDHSGNKNDGSPYMMRKAQRKVIVTALQAQLTANQEILNETNRFNIVSAPGYVECIDEMLALSVNRKDTVFCVADAPMRLSADATSTQNWATNANNAGENGEDGLISASSQAAVYYPHGLSTSLDGTSVMVPASHMALRTIAFNDSVAFPWFAPAGFQRGVVNNATSTGYLNATTGEFTPVSLSEGQRDSLYSNKINPIGNFPGRGIAVFGQKTLNSVSSALDRINVSRLVIYIREQLDDAVKPFLFEPNDEVTRANAKVVVDRLLAQLVQQRGLFDFVTVCDTTNNTAARIDRNELYIDIAVQPVKAVEFIYIPIRIQNTLGSTA